MGEKRLGTLYACWVSCDDIYSLLKGGRIFIRETTCGFHSEYHFTLFFANTCARFTVYKFLAVHSFFAITTNGKSLRLGYDHTRI